MTLLGQVDYVRVFWTHNNDKTLFLVGINDHDTAKELFTDYMNSINLTWNNMSMIYSTNDQGKMDALITRCEIDSYLPMDDASYILLTN